MSHLEIYPGILSVTASKLLRMLFLREPNGFQAKKNDFAPRLDAGSVKDSVMPLLVSVKIGFLEPFGNLLAPFECGCFQTP